MLFKRAKQIGMSRESIYDGAGGSKVRWALVEIINLDWVGPKVDGKEVASKLRYRRSEKPISFRTRFHPGNLNPMEVFEVGFPKKYRAEDAPAEVLELAKRLVPLLIEGDYPALAALRQQLPRAHVKEVELTGCGFYLDFEVPQDVPLAQPADFAGGDARLSVQGVKNGAGCVLFVRGGRLATLEGYRYRFGNAVQTFTWS
jgi:hypothetical protein